jgi:hypothetical protein
MLGRDLDEVLRDWTAAPETMRFVGTRHVDEVMPEALPLLDAEQCRHLLTATPVTSRFCQRADLRRLERDGGAVRLFDLQSLDTTYRVFLFPDSLLVDLSFTAGAVAQSGPKFNMLRLGSKHVRTTRQRRRRAVRCDPCRSP